MKIKKLPITVLMITLNEEHNIERVLNNLKDFASEIFILDSFSNDKTIDIANKFDIRIYQRNFKNFGDQWNFASNQLPISYPWTMKLDPDESITDDLKRAISEVIFKDSYDYISFPRRLWFMNRPLSVKQRVTRVWRTGLCRFDDVIVNEHPIINGKEIVLTEFLEHYDSPNLHHWIKKQNNYTTLEAKTKFKKRKNLNNKRLNKIIFIESKKVLLKSIFNNIIFQDLLVFLYCYFIMGAFKDGKVGFIWSKMRCLVYKLRRLKYLEMNWIGKEYNISYPSPGLPNDFAEQIYNEE